MLRLKIRASELWLGILLSVALIALGMMYQSSQRPQQTSQNHAATHKVEKISAPSSADERIADYTLALAWLTSVLALCNIGLWVVTGLTLRHSRKTAERQLRAYICVMIGEGYRQGATKGLRFEFRPRIVNTGETPAYGVNISGDIKFLSIDEAKSFDFKANVPPQSEKGVLTLGRNQDRFTNSVLSRRLTRQELRQFLAHTHNLYVFGTVTYRDTFKNERFTNYCFSIAAWNRRSLPTWRTTYRHNESN